ncbi:MAG: glutamate formiminotransferase / 5-formyltetrahydrofolate cyclo-ligase [Bacillota bacterium]|nr:glutamate formiminotransferase / 5-formyltetrahydrofolate cyclo-ligase [Bacillota bacterium]
MARKIVECVPNFSEGRRPEVVREIVAAVESVPGVQLLDYSSDPSHNRSVLTFIGEPAPVKEAAFRAIAKAAELINMEEHRGEHPRIGATDVVPFVPVLGVTMADCVALARELGAEVAEKLRIPVYLYEEAATRPDRRNLADIRRGEYEGLKREIHLPERRPDFGEPVMHPTAGATVIGAREFLIAYNINLGTPDVSIAKKIARVVRASSGGLMYVKALGIKLGDRNLAQVSMNLTNFKKTPMHVVFNLVKSEAERYGVPIVGSEIVGLVPLDALLAAAEHYLRIENFSRKQVLETRVWE